jgi:pantoate--beta-alanine ligase
VRAWRSALAGDVGLVPTMGFLHEGHVSLVERARRENAHVVVSLFVNPTQFGPREDLAAYPRDLDRDRALLRDAGCDLLFAPAAAEMYPPGAATVVDVGAVAAPLEGERRPGHFRGVATVVLKLLNIAQPTRAYFGEKDAQQLAVIRRMTRDLAFGIEIVGHPIVREPDGLALSSRNVYLTPEERRDALVLSASLRAARAAIAAGERRADRLLELVRRELATGPGEIDYAGLVDAESFAPIEFLDRRAVLPIVVRFGKTRLLDNLQIDIGSAGEPAGRL